MIVRPPVPADLIRTASDRAAIEAGCWFDEAAAERVRQFFYKFCRHSQGPDSGKPFELLDWQWHGIIRPLFGWKNPDGTRRYKRATIFVPRRNGKTFLCAGIAKYMLFADGEPGAEIYIVASDQEQAGKCHKYIQQSIEQVPSLDRRCSIKKNYPKTITYGFNELKVLSGSKTGRTGQNCSCLIFDEIHEQKDRTVLDALSKSQGSRTQPLFVIISTCGEITSGPGKSEFDYALKIQNSEAVDINLLPCVYAADESLPWDSEEAFASANPSYKYVIPRWVFEAEITKAKNDPTAESGYKTYLLNRWIGSASIWIQADKWKRCELPESEWPFDPLKEPCVIGADYGRRYDLTAYAMVWRVNGTYYVRPHFFIPHDVLDEREKKDHFRYRAYSDPKFNLTVTPGNEVDYLLLAEHMMARVDTHKVRMVAYDPTGFGEARHALDRRGITCVEAPPSNWKLIGGASAEFERAILTGKLRHPGNPILDWNLSNCVPRPSPWGDLVRPEKASEGSKIDGIAATINAVAAWQEEDDPLNRIPVFLG